MDEQNNRSANIPPEKVKQQTVQNKIAELKSKKNLLLVFIFFIIVTVIGVGIFYYFGYYQKTDITPEENDSISEFDNNKVKTQKIEKQKLIQNEDELINVNIKEKDEASLDPDNDGLTNEEEKLYGTNPQNPDTDGDGFLDGDEVANGYNPNGDGVLTKNIQDLNIRVAIFGRNGDDLNEESVSEIDMINFAFQLGKEAADLNFCDKFRSFRHNFLGACYAGVAINMDDSKICDKAPPQDSISECYQILAYVKKDISLCKNVIEMHRAACFLRAGYGIQDYDACENAELPENKNPFNNFDPLDTCKIGVGLAIKDSSICEEVKNEVNKDNCYARMAVETKDLNLCDKMKFPSHCYENVALSRRDISICNRYTDPYNKSNCINPIIAHNPNIKICESFENNLIRMSCYHVVAVATRDPDICKNINNSRFYGICIGFIAKSSGNLELCNKIDDSDKVVNRKLCQEDVKELLKQSAICEIIKNNSLKKDCKEILTRWN